MCNQPTITLLDGACHRGAETWTTESSDQACRGLPPHHPCPRDVSRHCGNTDGHCYDVDVRRLPRHPPPRLRQCQGGGGTGERAPPPAPYMCRVRIDPPAATLNNERGERRRSITRGATSWPLGCFVRADLVDKLL
jgi:hypothetical protein